MPEIPIVALQRLVGGAALAGGLLYLSWHSLFSVAPGERAIKFNVFRGVLPEVLSEGTHILIPLVERPIVFDVRTRPRAIKSTTGTRGESNDVAITTSSLPLLYSTKPIPHPPTFASCCSADLQMVDIGLRVLTRPDASALPDIYRRLGMDYDDKVLPSIVTEVVKQVIAQFNATALLTQREQVSRKIKDLLADRAKEFHIVLQDVSITDLKFGREFELAVERKQVAQQEAERARFIVDMAQQEKVSIIIKAQGEATSAEMIGMAAAQNPGFVQLRRIDAAKDVAQIVADGANTVYMSADALLLNLASDVDSNAGK